jgi:hypothetical protein
MLWLDTFLDLKIDAGGVGTCKQYGVNQLVVNHSAEAQSSSHVKV